MNYPTRKQIAQANNAQLDEWFNHVPAPREDDEISKFSLICKLLRSEIKVSAPVLSSHIYLPKENTVKDCRIAFANFIREQRKERQQSGLKDYGFWLGLIVGWDGCLTAIINNDFDH